MAQSFAAMVLQLNERLPMRSCKTAIPTRRPRSPAIAVCLVAGVSAGVLAGNITGQGPAPRAVEALLVEPSDLQHKIVLNAEVFALETARLVPQVTGQVTEIPVSEGDLVEGDKVLVKIACPDLEADKNIADAMQAEAAAGVGVAENSRAAALQAVKVAEADVQARRTAEAAAQAISDLAEINYARARRLLAEEAETLEAVERMEVELQAAKARLDAAHAGTQSAKARLVAAQSMVQVREAEVVSAQAAATMAEAKAKKAALIAGFATIRNPYARARVTLQLLDPGTLVRANETPMLEVMNTDKVRIRFGVPESEAGRVRPGTRVRLIQPRSGLDDVEATVTRVTSAVNTSSRAMDAEVELANADGRWLPGNLVRVEVTILERQNAIAIPAKAMVKRGPDTFVWIANNDRAQRKKVKLGLDLGRNVEVLDGVAAGDLVLVVGFSGLREGAPLSVRRTGQQP